MSKELFDYYEKFSDEELIKYRARGLDALSADAQKIIYEILQGRGISPPEIPVKAINIDGIRKKKVTNGQIAVRIFIWLFVISILRAILQKMNHPLGAEFLVYIGIVIAITYVIFCVYKNRKNKSSTLESNIGSKGFNEFMFSAAVGDIRRMGELIAYGAEVNLQDDAGVTAIMYAIDKGQVEAVKFLLSNGADLTLKTNQGRDCMELVKLSNNDALLSLFRK
jgi:hypothetical protein